jgi:aspartate/methionine/tyrosine aminotransferase
MREGLEGAGYRALPAEGTYFMTVDLAASGIDLDDRTFCERAVREAGIAAIPLSALYAKDAVTTTIRLCFAKLDSTIDAGVEGLAAARRLFAT